jgi:hypothetical protein
MYKNKNEVWKSVFKSEHEKQFFDGETTETSWTLDMGIMCSIAFEHWKCSKNQFCWFYYANSFGEVDTYIDTCSTTLAPAAATSSSIGNVKQKVVFDAFPCCSNIYAHGDNSNSNVVETMNLWVKIAQNFSISIKIYIPGKFKWVLISRKTCIVCRLGSNQLYVCFVSIVLQMVCVTMVVAIF